MFLLEWTTSDLLLIVVGAIAVIGTVLWLVPSANIPRKCVYSSTEITQYDTHIPSYFLVAAFALLVGSVHMVIKNTPGFWQWLWQAGYGGHLFRDLANSHIIIVGGGTVLLTGTTWYLLPRFAKRPLYSNELASASLWFTVLGVFGFYIAWLVLGLVEGSMVHQGWTYLDAKAFVGSWHSVPTRMTATLMGVGYWTYVLNVFLTAAAARHVSDKSQAHLIKFSVVSAAALFVGTVQGVIQVLPANADWIHLAGKFGQYVDPISHAHINLVTGMIVSLAAFLIYFSQQMGGTLPERRTANLLFWTIVPGSLLFYLTFLLTGLILGGQANGYGGIQSPVLAAFISRWRVVAMAVSGLAMLTGFWVYFRLIWRTLHLRSLATQFHQATPKAFWLVSSIVLVVGTFHGVLQIFPGISYYLTTPEEVPNIHAQLNMVGGVLLALIGIVYLLLPELTGQYVSQRLRQLTLWGMTGGITTYYVLTLFSGLARLELMRQGMDGVTAALALWRGVPLFLLLAALPVLIGVGAFGTAVYKATSNYRADIKMHLRQIPARFTGPMPERLQRIPRGYVVAIELVGGLLGWPGLGWLFSGQALPAVFLLLAGPSVAWALLPALSSPFSDTIFSQMGWPVMLLWLGGTAVLSSGLLAFFLHRQLDRDPSTSSRHWLRRMPRGQVLGVTFVLLTLFSVPLIPLLAGIPTQQEEPVAMDALPERADGAYLSVADASESGFLKLFPWSFPPETFPAESPTLNPDFIQSVVVSQKGVADADRYLLFHLDDNSFIPLQSEGITFQRQLRLIPAAPLEPGNYMLDIPIGGMFAGRNYYFFRVDTAVTTLPPIVSTEIQAPATAKTADAPSWLTLLPLSSTLISGIMALIMFQRMRQKIRAQEAAWAIAFTMFALAAGSQVVGDIYGWRPVLAKLYYLCGATLVVGWLGLGTWLVLVKNDRLRSWGTWLTILFSGYALGLMTLVPVDQSALAETGWHALQKPTVLTILTISFNSLGTLVLVGGALWSAWVFWRRGIMRARMYGLLLLAGGALTVAAGGSLTRFGHEEYLYIAMSIGVSLIFWGYLKTIQPSKALSKPVSPPVSTLHPTLNLGEASK